MNALERYIVNHKALERMTMNILQDNGIISDECVTAKDVAPVDADRAVKWLEETR